MNPDLNRIFSGGGWYVSNGPISIAFDWAVRCRAWTCHPANWVLAFQFTEVSAYGLLLISPVWRH